MGSIEMEGKSVEEAVEKALQELAATRDNVSVEVLEEGAKGLFGLGGKIARVKVTVQAGGLDRVTQATTKLLELMGLPSKVSITQQEDRVLVEIHDSYDGLLIGRRATALEAIETLIKRMVYRNDGERLRLVLDIDGYRRRREEKLIDMAKQAVEKVLETGNEVSFDPMDAGERRVIHMAIKDHAEVMTESRGEGESRRVVVRSKS